MSEVDKAEKNCINCIGAGTPCYKSPCYECKCKSKWEGKTTSDIDKAITHLKSDINTYQNMLNGFNGPIDADAAKIINASIETYKIAIQALQEKQRCKGSPDYEAIAKENHSKCTNAYVEILKLEREVERLKAINEALQNDLINANMNLEHVTEGLKQHEWIPVSERLPEGDGTYQVTVRYENFAGIYITVNPAKFVVGKGWTILGIQPVISNKLVIAWKLLSEPYKEVAE